MLSVALQVLHTSEEVCPMGVLGAGASCSTLSVERVNSCAVVKYCPFTFFCLLKAGHSTGIRGRLIHWVISSPYVFKEKIIKRVDTSFFMFLTL